LDGTGWHPSAWRERDARPRAIFGGAYWRDLARTAEDAWIDLITIEDALGLQSPVLGAIDSTVTNEVRGRLDAVLVASWLAPLTRRIGLVPR
jgi:alkanesulfonate monooxygenase SsuD/methylene tetrahydromethanopterin reductase-like flavin-dependent oxidoreductase (luciferase family)